MFGVFMSNKSLDQVLVEARGIWIETVTAAHQDHIAQGYEPDADSPQKAIITKGLAVGEGMGNIFRHLSTSEKFSASQMSRMFTTLHLKAGTRQPVISPDVFSGSLLEIPEHISPACR